MTGAGGRPPYARDAIVLALAVGVFGVSFGVLASTAGLSLAKTMAMSVFVFTGASQFAAVGVIDSGGSTATALGSALLLAARNAAYGIALSPRLAIPRRRKLVAAQFVLDESTAMATARDDDAEATGAFWTTGIAVFVCWNIGTLAGALLGGNIGDPAAFGLDAAFPAGFIALAMPHLRSRRGQVAALAGVAIAVALIPLTPAGTPILAAALGVVPAVFVAPPEGRR